MDHVSDFSIFYSYLGLQKKFLKCRIAEPGQIRVNVHYNSLYTEKTPKAQLKKKWVWKQ